jgi:hypothetical protein
MPDRLNWSQPQDLQLRRMRTEGASWDEIAAALRVSRWSAIERGRKIGASQRHRSPDEPAPCRAPDLGREPLPPGHGTSWGALIGHTLLHGQSYPSPPLSHGA